MNVAIRGAVIAAVADAAELPPEAVRDRADADLVADLAIDSLRLLEVWAALERRFGLAEGILGASQAVTLEGIAEDVVEALQRTEPR